MKKRNIAAMMLAAVLVLSGCSAPAGVKEDGKLKIVFFLAAKRQMGKKAFRCEIRQNSALF